MSTVSPNQIATNAAITSSGVNTPINQLAAVINGGLDDSNVSSLSGTKIASGTTPAAAMATAANPETRGAELFFDHVASGLVWTGDSYGSTRNASMTAGVIYIAGKRVPVTAVSARAFTASRDTYVDVGDDGVVDYNEVTNNLASPSLAANHVRVAIIVTGASNIANVGSVNQGQPDKVLPIASPVPYTRTDSLGNLICPRDPQRRVVGYRQYYTAQGSVGTTPIQANGLSTTVTVPSGRSVKITAAFSNISCTSAAAGYISIWDGTVSSGTKLAQTELYMTTSGTGNSISTVALVTPAATVKSYNVGVQVSGGTGTLNPSVSNPHVLIVELV